MTRNKIDNPNVGRILTVSFIYKDYILQTSMGVWDDFGDLFIQAFFK